MPGHTDRDSHGGSAARGLLDTLQPIDIQYRTKCLQLAVARTDVFQVISDYTGQRLQLHGGKWNPPESFAPTSLFTIVSFPAPTGAGRRENASYFFYPGNAWAHRNHLTLLVAFAIYRQRTPIAPGASC